MTYDLNSLVAKPQVPKVYDTLILTLLGRQEPKIEKFKTEAEARKTARLIALDWSKLPNSSYKVIDDFNIMLMHDQTSAVLLTLEFDVMEGSLDLIERSSFNGKS